MMRDKAVGRGVLLVEQFDSRGKLVGLARGGNLWVTTGIDEIFLLMGGLGGAPWNNANALIGIGDDTTAPADTQSDLLAPVNKTYKGMDVGYPQAGAAKSMLWRATFAAGDANYDWQEFTLKHNGSGICVNRGVSFLGTKVPGSVWVATLTLSLA
jgi:hypothetical protein